MHTALSRISNGGIEVTYWDGDVKRYGPEKPWVGIHFRTESIAKKMRKNLDLAVGEGYMSGEIEVTGDLADLSRLGEANLPELKKTLAIPRARKKSGSKKAEFKDVQHHYDLGNDFYKLWLDDSLTYSCAYFRTSRDSLEAAQRQKVEHILRKLNLKRGQRMLDIGSGWGELIIRAAKRYGVVAHGITLSKEQLSATKERIAKEGLTGKVTVELKHYEDLKGNGTYDRVVSVGMYEHVGQGHHARYMATVNRLLKPEGVSLLHTITQFEDRGMSSWTDKYIFPGGYIPTLEDTLKHQAEHGFHTVDVESLRRHYAKTLDEWARRFEQHVDEVTKMYDTRFVRMWRLYLRSAYAGFAYGNLDLSQILFTKGLSDEVPMTREYMYRGKS